MMMLSMSAFAQTSPTASTDVYDLTNFGEELVDLFYAAEQQGRKFPTQEEFEAAGFNMMDMAFVRSHVRPRAALVDQTKNVNQGAKDNRLLWMNIPIGIGKIKGGYPSSNWNDDPYTGWNYTKVFGSWNHGVFHVPGVAVDCAHKNGADIYAGIKFFESWTAGAGAEGWVGKVQTKDPNGYEGYKYVRPLVNAMMFFGQDGLNYNFEDTGYANADVVGFHQACYKYAKEIGFDNFHIGIYTAQSSLTASNVEGLFGKNNVKTADAFLNYSSGDFAVTNMRNSYQTAVGALGTAEGVYQGAWIASMARKWTGLDANEQARSIGIVLWGEHGESRIHSNTTGNSAIDYQENYQKLQERLFSGGYRNPAARPAPTNSADWFTSDPKNNALRNFQGVAEYIPERTALKQNLPFQTFFNVGNGEVYNYKGKKTMGNWYNLGQQDIVPTYRWLVYDKGTTNPVTEVYDVNGGIPEFTNADAYIGGSCLRLTNTKAVDIVLYRAELTVSEGNPTVTVALKNFNGPTEGSVSVIVKKQGSNTWEETPLANVKGNTWEAQTVGLNGVAKGDVIEYVGLRTSGNTAGTLIGQLTLADDRTVAPADVKDAVVEVKEETQVSLSVKVRWDVDAVAGTRADYDLLYNDEAGIDHFEVFYKNGEKGRVSEVARTTSWGAYVGNIPMAEDEKPFIGVRSVSVDGKSTSDVVWVEVPRADASTLPEKSQASDAYPLSILNESSEGITNALNQRYVNKLEVKGSDADFSYVNTAGTPYMQDIAAGKSDAEADKTNYILAGDQYTIKCHQGQKLSFTMDYATESDGLQYCTFRGYMDWDGDFNFNGGNDEVVVAIGEDKANKANTDLTHPTNFEVNVPTDAMPGKSRLRLVFSDAWFPHPGASGTTAKGFTVDFPMEITGSNPGRTAIEVRDQGVADEPEGIVPVGIVAPKAKVSDVTIEGEAIRFENTDKAWIFTADGRLVKFIKENDPVLSTQKLAPGAYLIRMQSGQVQRTKKIVVK